MNSRRYYDNARVSDHHAIVPTDRRPNLNALGADERKLYDLIARRLIAAHYPDCEFDAARVVTRVDGIASARPARRPCARAGARSAAARRTRRRRGSQSSSPATRGAWRRFRFGRADQAAARPYGRVHPQPDGERRARDRGRGAARADEVVRIGHARHARGRDRAADRGRLRAARRQDDRFHREGQAADRRRAGADRLRRHHGKVGKGARRAGRLCRRRGARREGGAVHAGHPPVFAVSGGRGEAGARGRALRARAGSRAAGRALRRRRGEAGKGGLAQAGEGAGRGEAPGRAEEKRATAWNNRAGGANSFDFFCAGCRKNGGARRSE